MSALGGGLALVGLWRHRNLAARTGAVVAVAAVVAGWGAAQYPWVLVDSARISDVAAPAATLWSLVGVFVIAGVTVVPALAYLLWLTQRPDWAEERDRT